MSQPLITVAIPTYERGEILVRTLERLLALPEPPDAFIVADQTIKHPDAVQGRLESWAQAGTIRWLRFGVPSIPHAMNAALLAATTEVVLFLDDDIEPDQRLVAFHCAAHRDTSVDAVAGQILQPGEVPQHHIRPADDLEFRFNHDAPCAITNVMAGNLSVKRDQAIAIGGFDENFTGAAYRFESDFALRLIDAGGAIHFDPKASLRHLKLDSGGLRALGDHRSGGAQQHAVGAYYYSLLHDASFVHAVADRLRRNVLTRYLAVHPWLIPAKLVGELRAIGKARRLHRAGRRLLGMGNAAPPRSA